MSKQAVQDEFQSYRELGTVLARSLDKQQDIGQQLSQYQQTHSISLALDSAENFPLPPSLAEHFKQGEPLLLEDDSEVTINFWLPEHQQILMLKMIINDKQQVSRLQMSLTLLFYVGILALVLVWLYPLINRLQKLAKVAKAFGEGDLTRRIARSSTSYIADIEREFNHMAARIETLVNDNKLLGNAVSHDLRTPLARLRFGIEALEDTKDVQKREKYQQHLAKDIDEMERLVNVLLNYARLEQKLDSLGKELVDLSSLVAHCIDSQHMPDTEIRQTIQSGLKVQGEANYLSMLVNNLLINAHQYANGCISVGLSRNGQYVQLTVEDNGPGIPFEKRQELLKPFIRGDNPDVTPGYGMGLAIVSRISQWHSADLEIAHSVELGGAKFCVFFHAVSK
nr:ATP-binding protein [Neptunicella marina]